MLGTPTYTVFMPELAAVDAELIRRGRITDLREPGRFPRVEKKKTPAGHARGRARRCDLRHDRSDAPRRSAPAAERPRGYPGDDLAGGDVPRHDCARADERRAAPIRTPPSMTAPEPIDAPLLDDRRAELPVVASLCSSPPRRWPQAACR